MVTDYEAAWLELSALIASKSQHGRDALLREMAEITARQRVPSGELSRLLRLYGVEVERARLTAAETDRDGPDRFASGFGSLEDDATPEHHRPGGHDGDRHRHRAQVGAGAGAGAGR